MATYSITKSLLCFVCHSKPDKCQENLDCCCCCPDNAFLYENKSAKQNMLEYILKGSNNTVMHIIKMRFIHPTTMERNLHSGNWLDIYLSYQRTHRRLKYDQLVDWVSYSLQSLPGPQLISTISHLYQSEIKFYKTYPLSWNIELVWLEIKIKSI